MTKFAIDSDNIITVYAGGDAVPQDQIRFTSERELARLAANWPNDRLVEIWNSFAGAPPFGDLKPVKKFTNRKTAVGRIWRAIQALTPAPVPQAAPVAPKKDKATNEAKPQGDATGLQATREGSKKATVLDMLKRPAGATLADIMAATGWQAHSVRGFISGGLSKKMGIQVESFKSLSGDRAYRIAR